MGAAAQAIPSTASGLDILTRRGGAGRIPVLHDRSTLVVAIPTSVAVGADAVVLCTCRRARQRDHGMSRKVNVPFGDSTQPCQTRSVSRAVGLSNDPE